MLSIVTCVLNNMASSVLDIWLYSHEEHYLKVEKKALIPQHQLFNYCQGKGA